MRVIISIILSFLAIVAKQFRDLKFGDRFYYENGIDVRTRFAPDQLDELRKSSIARLMCDNLDIKFVQQNAFFPASPTNPIVDCKSLKKMNLSKWKNEKLPSEIQSF